MRRLIAVTVLTLAACSPAENLDTLYPANTDLTATQIMSHAHAAAGGESWVAPKSLTMKGYAVFYKDGKASLNQTHNMWRVYARGKTDAHRADGKVRIESVRDGKTLMDLSFDGARTYTPAGPMEPSASDARWSSAFGFGVIRHALDEGYTLSRLPDDLVDGRPAYHVKVTDPKGGETQFAIAYDNHAILKVAFDTPRGWHERIYSNFYSNPGTSWVQPGRVRLYYNGVKGNEVIWTSFAIDQDLPECLFVLPESEGCR